MCGLRFGLACRKHPKSKKSKNGLLRMQSLTTLEKLRGIYFIDPEDEGSKEIIFFKKKNARKKLETPLEAAMPCKMVTRKRFKEQRETVASGDVHSHENQVCWYCGSSRINKEAFGIYSSREIMTITSRRRGFNSLNHCNLVHKFIPMLQAMKIPDAKAAVNKEWREARENPCLADG